MDIELTPTKSTHTIVSSSGTTAIEFKSSPETVIQSKGNDVGQPSAIAHSEQQLQLIVPIATPALSAQQRLSLINSRAIKFSKIFDKFKTGSSNQYIYSLQPPSAKDLTVELKTLQLPSKIYQAPYYSKDEDIPELPKEYAGLIYRLKGGQGIATLEEWSTSVYEHGSQHSKSILPLEASGVGGWEFASHPPSVREIRNSLHLLDDEFFDPKKVVKSQVKTFAQKNTIIPSHPTFVTDRRPYSGQYIWLENVSSKRY
jgi:hypothetical protein